MTARPGNRKLELMRRAAPARRLHVGILDREPGTEHVVVDVVDLATREIGGAVMIDIDLDALGLDDIVGGGDVVPTELIRHTGAAAADHANAEPPLGLAFLEPQIRDLLRGNLGQCDHARLLGGLGYDSLAVRHYTNLPRLADPAPAITLR